MSNPKTRRRRKRIVANKDAVDFMRLLSLYMLARWTSRLAESGKSVMLDAYETYQAQNGWGAWYLAEQAKRDRDEELERRERDYDYEQAIGGRNLGR